MALKVIRFYLNKMWYEKGASVVFEEREWHGLLYLKTILQRAF